MFWHVYNSLSGEQRVIEDQNLSGFLTSLKDDQAPYTFLWQASWPDWKAFLEVPELVSLRKQIPAPPPRGFRAHTSDEPTPQKKNPPVLTLEASQVVPVPPEIPKAATTEPDFEGTMFSTKTSAPTFTSLPKKPVKPPPGAKKNEERRQAPRLEASLNVIITADGAVFRTLSADMSATGLCLEHPVPASMLRRPVQLVISSPNMSSKLRLNAQLVGDAKDGKRFRFLEPTEAQTRQINEWIRGVQTIAKRTG